MTVTTRTRPSRFLFQWEASDGLTSSGGITARTGQVGTFDRGGTTGAASAGDANGRVFFPGYKTPRFHHQYSATSGLWEPAGLQLEGSRANLCPYSEDQANWTAGGAISVSANTTIAPDGTLTADTLTRVAAAGEYTYKVVAFTADATKVLSLYVKQGSGSVNNISLRDTSAAVTRALMVVTWSGGVPAVTVGAGAAAIFAPEYCGNGWYRIAWAPTGVVAANNNEYQIYPSNALAGTGANGDSLIVWGAQAENATIPSMYIKTVAAAVTRSADALTFALNRTAFTTATDDLTFYLKMARPVWYASSGLNQGMFQWSTTGARIYCGASGTNIIARVSDGSSTETATAAMPTTSPTEVAINVKDIAAAASLRLDVGAGFGAYTTPIAAISALGNTTLEVGSATDFGASTFGAVTAVRIASGIQTLAYMAAA